MRSLCPWLDLVHFAIQFREVSIYVWQSLPLVQIQFLFLFDGTFQFRQSKQDQ